MPGLMPAQAKKQDAKPASRPAPQASAAWQRDKVGRFQRFGAGLAAKLAPPIVSTTELVTHLDKYAGKTLRVSGTVEQTCAKKGCWMWVTEGRQRVFVRFKDYAFFVPTKGAGGRQVVFEGVVQRKRLSVAEARHYAEDAGDHEAAKKIVKPVDVPFVMATGVRMYAKVKRG